MKFFGYSKIDLEADVENGESWKDIVYDYRWIEEKETYNMGFPPKT